MVNWWRLDFEKKKKKHRRARDNHEVLSLFYFILSVRPSVCPFVGASKKTGDWRHRVGKFFLSSCLIIHSSWNLIITFFLPLTSLFWLFKLKLLSVESLMFPGQTGPGQTQGNLFHSGKNVTILAPIYWQWLAFLPKGTNLSWDWDHLPPRGCDIFDAS